MHRYLRIASHLSVKGPRIRKAYIGAVGVRSDGRIVTAVNGCALDVEPRCHAEARLIRKLDAGSVVYVARTRRDDGRLAMARPCKACEDKLRHRGVRRVEYSISEGEFGVMEFS